MQVGRSTIGTEASRPALVAQGKHEATGNGPRKERDGREKDSSSNVDKVNWDMEHRPRRDRAEGREKE